MPTIFFGFNTVCPLLSKDGAREVLRSGMGLVYTPSVKQQLSPNDPLLAGPFRCIPYFSLIKLIVDASSVLYRVGVNVRLLIAVEAEVDTDNTLADLLRQIFAGAVEIIEFPRDQPFSDELIKQRCQPGDEIVFVGDPALIPANSEKISCVNLTDFAQRIGSDAAAGRASLHHPDNVGFLVEAFLRAARSPFLAFAASRVVLAAHDAEAKYEGAHSYMSHPLWVELLQTTRNFNHPALSSAFQHIADHFKHLQLVADDQHMPAHIETIIHFLTEPLPESGYKACLINMIPDGIIAEFRSCLDIPDFQDLPTIFLMWCSAQLRPFTHAGSALLVHIVKNLQQFVLGEKPALLKTIRKDLDALHQALINEITQLNSRQRNAEDIAREAFEVPTKEIPFQYDGMDMTTTFFSPITQGSTPVLLDMDGMVSVRAVTQEPVPQDPNSLRAVDRRKMLSEAELIFLLKSGCIFDSRGQVVSVNLDGLSDPDRIFFLASIRRDLSELGERNSRHFLSLMGIHPTQAEYNRLEASFSAFHSLVPQRALYRLLGPVAERLGIQYLFGSQRLVMPEELYREARNIATTLGDANSFSAFTEQAIDALRQTAQELLQQSYQAFSQMLLKLVEDLLSEGILPEQNNVAYQYMQALAELCASSSNGLRENDDKIQKLYQDYRDTLTLGQIQHLNGLYDAMLKACKQDDPEFPASELIWKMFFETGSRAIRAFERLNNFYFKPMAALQDGEREYFKALWSLHFRGLEAAQIERVNSAFTSLAVVKREEIASQIDSQRLRFIDQVKQRYVSTLTNHSKLWLLRAWQIQHQQSPLSMCWRKAWMVDDNEVYARGFPSFSHENTEALVDACFRGQRPLKEAVISDDALAQKIRPVLCNNSPMKVIAAFAVNPLLLSEDPIQRELSKVEALGLVNHPLLDAAMVACLRQALPQDNFQESLLSVLPLFLHQVKRQDFKREPIYHLRFVAQFLNWFVLSGKMSLLPREIQAMIQEAKRDVPEITELFLVARLFKAVCLHINAFIPQTVAEDLHLKLKELARYFAMVAVQGTLLESCAIPFVPEEQSYVGVNQQAIVTKPDLYDSFVLAYLNSMLIQENFNIFGAPVLLHDSFVFSPAEETHPYNEVLNFALFEGSSIQCLQWHDSLAEQKEQDGSAFLMRRLIAPNKLISVDLMVRITEHGGRITITSDYPIIFDPVSPQAREFDLTGLLSSLSALSTDDIVAVPFLELLIWEIEKHIEKREAGRDAQMRPEEYYSVVEMLFNLHREYETLAQSRFDFSTIQEELKCILNPERGFVFGEPYFERFVKAYAVIVAAAVCGATFWPFDTYSDHFDDNYGKEIMGLVNRQLLPLLTGSAVFFDAVALASLLFAGALAKRIYTGLTARECEKRARAVAASDPSASPIGHALTYNTMRWFSRPIPQNLLEAWRMLKEHQAARNVAPRIGFLSLPRSQTREEAFTPRQLVAIKAMLVLKYIMIPLVPVGFGIWEAYHQAVQLRRPVIVDLGDEVMRDILSATEFSGGADGFLRLLPILFIAFIILPDKLPIYVMQFFNWLFALCTPNNDVADIGEVVEGETQPLISVVAASLNDVEQASDDSLSDDDDAARLFIESKSPQKPKKGHMAFTAAAASGRGPAHFPGPPLPTESDPLLPRHEGRANYSGKINPGQ